MLVLFSSIPKESAIAFSSAGSITIPPKGLWFILMVPPLDLFLTSGARGAVCSGTLERPVGRRKQAQLHTWAPSAQGRCFVGLRSRTLHRLRRRHCCPQRWIRLCLLHYHGFTDSQNWFCVNGRGAIISPKFCSEDTEELNHLYWKTLPFPFFTKGNPIQKQSWAITVGGWMEHAILPRINIIIIEDLFSFS